MHIISNGHIVIFDLFEAVGWVVAITPHHRRATRAARCGANITSRLRRFSWPDAGYGGPASSFWMLGMVVRLRRFAGRMLGMAVRLRRFG